MARDTGEKENRQANEQYTAMQQDQLRRANAATDSFNSLLGKVRSGTPIAANPYKTSGYLRNQNLLTGAATSAQNAGAKELLNTDALRSGVNTSSRRATIADLGRQRIRSAADAATSQASTDNDKYLDWEKFILGSTLAPANVDTTLFSTQTQGRNNSLDNLTKLGVAAQQSWGNILGAALGAGGTFASSLSKPKQPQSSNGISS